MKGEAVKAVKVQYTHMHNIKYNTEHTIRNKIKVVYAFLWLLFPSLHAFLFVSERRKSSQRFAITLTIQIKGYDTLI